MLGLMKPAQPTGYIARLLSADRRTDSHIAALWNLILGQLRETKVAVVDTSQSRQKTTAPLIIPAIKLAVSADDAPRLFQQRNSDEL